MRKKQHASLRTWALACAHIPAHMDTGVCTCTCHREKYVQQTETAALGLVPLQSPWKSLSHCGRLLIAVPKGVQNLGLANFVFKGFQSLNCCISKPCML